jgi:hypothetical protein
MFPLKCVQVGVFVVVTLMSIGARADTADDYDSYVSQMIPLSFQFSDVSAGLKEHEVFINLLSTSQAELGNLSQLMNQIAEQGKTLVQAVPTECPLVPTGGLDQKKVLDALYSYQSLQGLIMQAREHFRTYQNIESSIQTACDHGLSHLHFGANDFTILTPRIELMDGAYVSVGDPYESLVNLISSLYSIFSNHSEQSRIQDSTDRFETQRAKDSDLQKSAGLACENEMNLLGESFTFLTSYARAADEQLKTVEGLPWLKMQNFLLDCIRSDEQADVAAWIQRAVQSVDTSTSDVTRNTIAKIRARQKIQAVIAQTGTLPCSDALKDQIDSSLGLSKLLGIDRETIYGRLKQAKTRCDGASS